MSPKNGPCGTRGLQVVTAPSHFILRPEQIANFTDRHPDSKPPDSSRNSGGGGAGGVCGGAGAGGRGGEDRLAAKEIPVAWRTTG